MSVIGQTIRDFEIVSELGAGGYGAVYKAHDTSVDRDVAIKVILPQYADNDDFKQRFESEAKTVARLESPRIVPLYSYWQDEQGAFLVMRLIRGGSLRKIMAKQGTMSLSQTLRIVSDIAEALSVAHENDVVHRDLKPENILIDERGNAYLTDFGIAKQTSATDNITEADAIVGTFAYLSPEQVQNVDVTPQTDIYAFGIMLYEMLAGKHPFHGTPAATMVMRQLHDILPDIYEERPDLPHELDDIIQKATAKDPSERYESTLDFIAELKSIVGTASMPSAALPKVTKKKPTTTEERNRFAMLDNVRTFWIEGVLENSLHDAAMIDLGLKSQSGAVDNPWDTLIRTPSGEEITMDGEIIDVFDRMNGKLLILGDPGSGKTTSMLTLARELLYRAEVDSAHPMPVVFNLSSWGEEQKPLVEWLVDELSSKYQVPRKVSQKWVVDEEMLLLLDGLDEVAGDVRNACVDAINVYREEHGFVDVVVCSRITDYDDLQSQLRLKGAIVIQPLDDDQIVTYIDGLGADTQVVRDLIARDVQLRELAHSPLMLSIMILAYRGKSAGDVPDFDNIDAQRQHLFDVYVERMFERRIGTPQYTQEETRHYLHWLASQMQYHVLSVFHIEDLQPNWLPTPDAIQHFPVQIRQMSAFYLATMWGIASTFFYFSADATSIWGWLLMMFFVMVSAILYGFNLTKEQSLASVDSVPWLDYIQVGIPFGIGFSAMLLFVEQPFPYPLALLVTMVMGVFLYGVHQRATVKLGLKADHIVFAENIQFRWFYWYPGLGISLITLLFTVLVTAYLLFPNSIEWNTTAIIIGLIFGVAMSILNAYILIGFSLGSVIRRTSPNQGLRNNISNLRRFVIYIFLAESLIAVAWALMGAPLDRVVIGWLGVMFLLPFGDAILSHGGTPIAQHLWLRYQLEREKSIPRNMTNFLDHGAAMVLLRKVGGGYIFIHRYLLEYFADLDTQSKP